LGSPQATSMAIMEVASNRRLQLLRSWSFALEDEPGLGLFWDKESTFVSQLTKLSGNTGV
jgi:hypothetical protein